MSMIVYPVDTDRTVQDEAERLFVEQLADRLLSDLAAIVRLANRYGVAKATVDRLVGASEVIGPVIDHIVNHGVIQPPPPTT